MPISIRRGSGSVVEHFESPVGERVGDLGAARLTDESAAPKWRIWEDLWPVPLGRSQQVEDGLVFSISPGEWMVVGGPPPAGAVDLTHVRAMFRLTGPGARTILEHVCALDLSDPITPDRAAARTLVAGVATELVRDDIRGELSYLLLLSRSFARHTWDRLVAITPQE